MSATITFNPVVTTVAPGSFNVSSDGYIQGTALNDPAVRNQLSGGVLATTETLPMWGGVGISETTTPATASGIPNLGGTLTRATSLTQTAANGLSGFSVFDQSHAMVNTPQSPVPLAGSLMSVNFYRLGSNARIVVALAPALVNLEGGPIGQQVSWDFNGQQLVPYVASYPANVLTAATWSSGSVTFTTTSAHGVAVGDYFSISGMTPAGYNGDFIAIAGTTGSTLVASLATNPGSETVLGTLVAGGGALACRVLDVQIGNSMTVSYDPVTGFATWNRAGNTAVILI